MLMIELDRNVFVSDKRKKKKEKKLKIKYKILIDLF